MALFIYDACSIAPNAMNAVLPRLHWSQLPSRLSNCGLSECDEVKNISSYWKHNNNYSCCRYNFSTKFWKQRNDGRYTLHDSISTREFENILFWPQNKWKFVQNWCQCRDSFSWYGDSGMGGDLIQAGFEAVEYLCYSLHHTQIVHSPRNKT